MKKRAVLFNLQLITLLFLLSSCSSPVLDDYSDVSYELIDQNGETVIFPDDFQGAPLLVGFIYTNCPDICSFITANIGKVYNELEDPVILSFYWSPSTRSGIHRKY